MNGVINKDATTVSTENKLYYIDYKLVWVVMCLAVLVFLMLASPALSARVLCVLLVPMLSHMSVFRTFTQDLAQRGHNVVILSPYPKSDLYPGINEIDVHNVSGTLWNQAINYTATMARNGQRPGPRSIIKFLFTANEIFDSQLGDPEVQQIIKNNEEQFELIYVESITWSTFGITNRFKAPVIPMSSLSASRSFFELVGAPTHPFLYADYHRKKLFGLSLWDKIYELLADLIFRYDQWNLMQSYNNIVKKHFPDAASVQQSALQATSLMLLNIYPIWEIVRPAPPTLVFVGGLHLKPARQLPQDLQSLLNNASQGAIYMSFGSMIRSADLDAKVVQNVLEVFRRLPYLVLWKWETDKLPGKPENVHVAKWFPQADLLMHPNIKLFITHGGLQSTDEAIRAEVPFVGIPFLPDQVHNAERYQHYGLGVALDVHKLTVEVFEGAIREVTGNPRYRENISRLALQISDQPESSRARAIWWSEYVLRHSGATHLRAPSAGFAAYLMLDVAAAVVATTLATLAAGVVLFRRVRLCVKKMWEGKNRKWAAIKVKKQAQKK